MKKFVCENENCHTENRCILFADNLCADPTMCPFDVPVPMEPHERSKLWKGCLIPEWIYIGDG